MVLKPIYDLSNPHFCLANYEMFTQYTCICMNIFRQYIYIQMCLCMPTLNAHPALGEPSLLLRGFI